MLAQDQSFVFAARTDCWRVEFHYYWVLPVTA